MIFQRTDRMRTGISSAPLGPEALASPLPFRSWWTGSFHRIFGRRSARVLLVQSMSLARITACVLFASLAFGNRGMPILVVFIYTLAMISDIADGYLSRKLDVETYFGKVMDLVADKSLTVVSLLYCAARGVPILPLALIAIREIVMLGMRLVIVEGTQILPTNRVFGGIMAALVWGTTLTLVSAGSAPVLVTISTAIYWGCAVTFIANLILRVRSSAKRIRAASMGNLS